MSNCVLSDVFQVALGVPTTENMENPSVMSKKKEKKVGVHCGLVAHSERPCYGDRVSTCTSDTAENVLCESIPPLPIAVELNRPDSVMEAVPVLVKVFCNTIVCLTCSTCTICPGLSCCELLYLDQ